MCVRSRELNMSDERKEFWMTGWGGGECSSGGRVEQFHGNQSLIQQ